MGYKVGTVLIDIKADTAKLVSGMEKAEKTVKKSVDNIKRTLVALAATYASIESIKAFTHMANEAYKAADATGKLAQTLGMTAEQLSKLEYVAGYADVSINKLQAALAAMIRRTTNFIRNGGGAAANALRELGISAEYARTHFTDTETTFKIIIDRLRQMPDGFRKTAIAQDIFSKNAAEVLRISSMSKDELKRYYEEAEKFSIAVPNWVANMSAVFDDTKAHIAAMEKGFKNKISYSLLPAVLSFAQTVDKWLGNAFNREEDFKELGEAAKSFFVGAIKGAGFLKDAFNGVKLVLKTIEVAFYGLATVVAVGFEPIRVFLNGLIKINNALADSWLGAKMHITRINGYFASAVPDNIEKIKELKNEITGLAHHLHDGRDEAEKLVKTFDNFYKLNEKHKKDWNEVKINKSTGLATDKTGNSALSDTIKKLNLLNNLQVIHNNMLQKQQNLLKQLKQQYTNLLPPKQQIESWYKNIVDTINKTITDPKLKKQALELALKIKVKKEQQLEIKQEKDNTIIFNSFEDIITTSIKKIFEHLGQEIPKWTNALINHIDTISFIVQKGISYLFDKTYDKIKAKYTGLINNLQQNIYTKQLQSKAYNTFGYQGYGALTEYQANVDNIKMLQAQNIMNYELMKKAKHYKEVTQHTLETLSIAAGTAAAIWFDGGAVLEGIKMAIKAQDWAEQATGFKNFQQAFIEGVDKLKQAVRDLADNLIQIAGNVYKSIKDYRSIFDKLTGTSTYKIQQYKESISYISQFSDLTVSSLSNLTQNVLKASKGFVESAVKSASDFKKLLGGDVFKQYGLAIEGLNDKFKESLETIASLIDVQRQAKDAIADYIAELKGSLGDTQYQLKYTQTEFAQALQDYYSGKIDGSTLLEKAKAYQTAGGDVSKIIKTLQGVEAQSTKDYLKGILEATTKFNTVGLPESNIKALQSPQIQTLNVIKDTKNILERILDILGGGFDNFGNLLGGILVSVKEIVKILKNIVGAIWGAVTSITKTIWSAVKNIASWIWNTGKNIVGAIWGAVTSITKTIWSAVKNIASWIWNTGKNIVGAIWGSISSFSKNVFNLFKSLTRTLFGNVWWLTKTMWGVSKNIVSSITYLSNQMWNVVKRILTGLSSVGGFLGSLLGKIGGFAVSLTGELLDAAGNLVSGATRLLGNITSGVGNVLSGAWHSISHGFGLWADGGYTGTGIGYVDSTGYPVAGVVHAGEWVAPAWMVNSMPNVFNALEGLRVSKSANNSLFNPVVNVAIDLTLIKETNSILVQQLSIQKKMLRLMQKFDEEGIKCVS